MELKLISKDNYMKYNYKWKYDKEKGRSVRAHRFFVKGNPKGKDVHHIDGNKENNNPSNLKAIKKGEHSAITNRERAEKCSVKDCNNVNYKKGLCKYHYNKILTKK